MNHSLVGLGGLFVIITRAIMIVLYSYSKKSWLDTFTITEFLIVSQLAMTFFCLFAYIFVIDKNAFHSKLNNVFNSMNTTKCVNLVLCSLCIPLLVYLSGYLNKYFNLSNMFVIKTSITFVLFQLMNYFYLGLPVTSKNIVTILLFITSMVLSVQF